MARFTNQWLAGVKKRNRCHTSIPVDIRFHEPSSPRPNYKVFIEIERNNYDYHLLYLTETDIAAILKKLNPPADDIAMSTLTAMSDKSLVEFLGKLFAN